MILPAFPQGTWILTPAPSSVFSSRWYIYKLICFYSRPASTTINSDNHIQTIHKALMMLLCPLVSPTALQFCLKKPSYGPRALEKTAGGGQPRAVGHLHWPFFIDDSGFFLDQNSPKPSQEPTLLIEDLIYEEEWALYENFHLLDITQETLGAAWPSEKIVESHDRKGYQVFWVLYT